MRNILLMNEIAPAALETLGAGYCADKACAAPEGVLVRSADMLQYDFPPALLAIARAGAGVNNIPLERCTNAGIAVFNTPGANANAVAELVVAGLLLAARDIAGGMQWALTLKGEGENVQKLVEKGKSRFTGPELAGKTLCVIGLGAIGALAANAAHGLGMRVIGYDPFISVRHAWSLSRAVKQAESMEEALAPADYVTLHIPLTRDTRGMFNASLLARMKPGAALLNFARGELADTPAVLDALKTGALRRYVTDFPCEALLGVPGAICIPHLGASTPESEENCARMAAEQLRLYLETGAIRNSVNLPDVELPKPCAHRAALIHLNIPNVLSLVTARVSAAGLNIANLVNLSRGEIAYTVLDTDDALSPQILTQFGELDGIRRVRAIR